jgi:ankyrin repeat protein
MDYENKYIKYKNKYIILKNQYGNGYLEYRAPACYKNNKKIIECEHINFNNTMGTCWMTSIFTVFLSSDSTSKCVQHILNNKDSVDIYNDSKQFLIDALPTSLSSEDNIINLLYYIKEKFNIKLNDKLNSLNPNPIGHELRRQASIRTEESFAKIIYSLFEKDPPTIDENEEILYGTEKNDQFFIVNILSSLLLKKLISFNIFKLNTKIEKKLLKNTIGILISINNHVCSFYICENNMKFCNNDEIINYNWIKLFNVCNALTESKKTYNIYIHNVSTSLERGPFIYVDNKMIYFDTTLITEEENSSNIKFDNNDDYLYVKSFVFLTYDNITTTFKKRNSIYYSNYYAELNKFVEYEKFIKRYNINSTDLNQIVEGLSTPLFISCQNNHEEIVRLLFRYEVNVNQPTNDSVSLYIACQNGHTEIVRLLLNHPKIKVNQPRNNGSTPLYIACQKGYTDIVDLLLARTEIKVNQPRNDRSTPLYIACQKNHFDIVNSLLSHIKIKINQFTNNGVTPLHIACHLNNTDIVVLLLARTEIKINQPTNNGETPLYIACREGHTEIVTLLLDQTEIKINQPNDNGQTPLFIACHQDNIDIVNLLLVRTEIEVNQPNDNGQTPLFIACYKGRNNIVTSLLEYSEIKVNQPMNNGDTPLFIACYKGRNNIVTSLLEYSEIEVNQPNDNGETPLFIACYKGRNNIVTSLLKCLEIDVNQPNDNGDTPLFIACYQGHAYIVTLLLMRSEIEVNKHNDNGQTPLSAAQYRGHTNIVNLLQDL